MNVLRSAIVLLFTAMLVIGAVSMPGKAYAGFENGGEVTISDPLEGINRAVYGFNKFLDKILLKPVAKTYRFVVPQIARKGIRNVLTNLTEPVTFLNSVLQGDVEHSFTTLWRFTINSTVGIAGLFDVVGDHGLRHRDEDFGQTLGKYGIGEGPYLVLPILGPSNGRDLVGAVADAFSDPYNYIFTDYAIAGRSVVKGIDRREGALNLIDDIDRTSLDPYATIRSLYTQRRLDEIRNGKMKGKAK